MGGSSSKEEKEAKKRSKAEKKQQREGKKSHRGSGEKDVVNDEITTPGVAASRGEGGAPDGVEGVPNVVEQSLFSLMVMAAHSKYKEENGEHDSLSMFEDAMQLGYSLPNWQSNACVLEGMIMHADALLCCDRLQEASDLLDRAQEFVVQNLAQGREHQLYKSAERSKMFILLKGLVSGGSSSGDRFVELASQGQQLYQQDGREGEAVPLFREAIQEGKKRENWQSDESVLTCMAQLADALGITGNYAEAERASFEVLPLLRKQIPSSRVTRAVMQRMLKIGQTQVGTLREFQTPYDEAVTHYKANQHSQALPLFRQALEFGERQPQHMMCRDVGVCMALLGDCYGRAGDIDDGIRLIDRSLEHLLPLVSEEDGIIAEIRSKLDTLRRRQRMREEGLGLFLSLCDEGQRIYQQDGREADAVPVLRQAVEEGKRLPNWESEPEILVCMAQLSDALRISQDMDASFEVGLETLPLLRAQFGEEDPRVKALEVRLVVAGMQISVENPGFHEPYRSGVTHYEAHQYQEAVQFFENAVQIGRGIKNSRVCREVGVCMALLGDAYGHLGEDEKGIQCMEESLKHLIPLVGKNDGVVKSVFPKLAALQMRHGRSHAQGAGCVPNVEEMGDAIAFALLASRGQELFAEDGKEPESIPILRQAVERGQRLSEWEQNVGVLTVMAVLGEALRFTGELEDSLEQFNAVKQHLEAHHPDNELLEKVKKSIGQVQLMILVKLVGGSRSQSGGTQGASATQQSGQSNIKAVLSRALALFAEDKFADAAQMLRESLAGEKAKPNWQHTEENFVCTCLLADCLEGMENFREAVAVLEDQVRELEGLDANRKRQFSATVVKSLRQLSDLLDQQERFADAISTRRKLLTHLVETQGEAHQESLQAMSELACGLARVEEMREALQLGRRCVELTPRRLQHEIWAKLIRMNVDSWSRLVGGDNL